MSDGTRALLTLLREHNVRRAEFLDGALASVEFHAPELPAPRLASLPTEGKAEDVCACGHTYTAHNADGECLYSCPVAHCEPPDSERTTPESAPVTGT